MPVPCPKAENAANAGVDSIPYRVQPGPPCVVSSHPGRCPLNASLRTCSFKRLMAASVMLGARMETWKRAFQPTVTSGSE
jgi:hypothetical protein